MNADAPAEIDAQRPVVISQDMLDPDGDSSRIELERGMRYLAPATLVLIAICTIVFVWQTAVGSLDNEASLVGSGALIQAGLVRGEIWRLLTSMFLHGGHGHLVGNMIPLFILGIACEHTFGAVKTVAIYLLAGLFGGVVSASIEPAPTVGASGAIFGLMGCLVALLYRLRRKVKVRDHRVACVVALWALWQIVLGFASPYIANFAHIGGLLAGGFLGLAIPSRLETP